MYISKYNKYKQVSLAGERTDKTAKIRVKKQATALAIRCGAHGRANAHHVHRGYSYNNNKHHKHYMRY